MTIPKAVFALHGKGLFYYTCWNWPFLIIVGSDQMKSFFQRVIDKTIGLVEQQLQAAEKEGVPDIKVGRVD
jgi:hypothetical protein